MKANQLHDAIIMADRLQRTIRQSVQRTSGDCSFED
jgi:hypothetical protein